MAQPRFIFCKSCLQFLQYVRFIIQNPPKAGICAYVSLSGDSDGKGCGNFKICVFDGLLVGMCVNSSPNSTCLICATFPHNCFQRVSPALGFCSRPNWGCCLGCPLCCSLCMCFPEGLEVQPQVFQFVLCFLHLYWILWLSQCGRHSR